ncbi:MAG: SPOR domain-containing protein [Betaproteobacteria bacterium]|nr:SPOR domain-containing protein [Betaproteobacteria bacterium]
MVTEVDPESLRTRHRRRLIGVIMIAGVAIIAIPWLMGQSRQPKQQVSAITPVTRSELPVPVSVPSQTSVPTMTTKLEAVELPPEPAIKPVVQKPLPKSSLPAPETERIWVQVGVFAHHDGVLVLDKKLHKMGFIPQIEPLTVAGGARWRVRVGPFATAGEGDHALKRLTTLGIKAMRVSQP